ncbi:MAG: hypothetical protein K9M75_04020 [Phycisphaerae bacterium]|nr:hypothetical protein [Phycisphaerae bacterium]
MKKLALILLVAILAMPALGEDVTPCKGDANGDGKVNLSDFGDLVILLTNHPGPWTDLCYNYGYCDYQIYPTDPDYKAVLDMDSNGVIDLSDLGDMVIRLANNKGDEPGWPGSCYDYGYCVYEYVCP